MIDIEAAAKTEHEVGAMVVVDNIGGFVATNVLRGLKTLAVRRSSAATGA